MTLKAAIVNNLAEKWKKREWWCPQGHSRVGSPHSWKNSNQNQSYGREKLKHRAPIFRRMSPARIREDGVRRISEWIATRTESYWTWKRSSGNHHGRKTNKGLKKVKKIEWHRLWPREMLKIMKKRQLLKEKRHQKARRQAQFFELKIEWLEQIETCKFMEKSIKLWRKSKVLDMISLRATRWLQKKHLLAQ